jgi:hypothetical protein
MFASQIVFSYCGQKACLKYGILHKAYMSDKLSVLFCKALETVLEIDLK